VMPRAPAPAQTPPEDPPRGGSAERGRLARSWAPALRRRPSCALNPGVRVWPLTGGDASPLLPAGQRLRRAGCWSSGVQESLSRWFNLN
jgi:hypothetical protein